MAVTPFPLARLFDLSGTTLSITLTNTLTATSPMYVLPGKKNEGFTQSDVLLGLFFDVAGNPTLTKGTANLTTGSTIIYNLASPQDTVAQTWAYNERRQ